jgi:hypothetical protein
MPSKTFDPSVTPLAWVPEENCYRIVEHSIETVTIGGSEQSFEVATMGDKVVWVDDAPDDIQDGSGHFEVYSGADEDYRPSMANPNPPAQEG